MIDYTDPDTIARQNIAPNAGCNIDGKFYDVRNLVHLASLQADRIEELTAKLRWVIDERDATFALMLKRTETAEAKLAECEARLRKALEGQKIKALEQILEERGAVFDAMVDAAEDAAGKDVSFNVVVGRALRAAIAEISSEAAINKGESHD